MKILLASPIDSDIMKKLQDQHQLIYAVGATPEELKKLIEGCEILVFRSGVKISADLMECSPDLKLLIRAGSGIDNLDIAYVKQRGLDLVRIPEPGAKAVAEMSFAFMLALSRMLFEADFNTRRGRWIKHELNGYLLTGKILGIIGVGNIGTRVGQLGAAWGMDVIGCVEHPSSARGADLNVKGIRLLDFEDVIAMADFISIHVPLKDTTRNLINAEALSHVKPGVVIINLARGGVLDEAALYKAMLEDGKIRGAALDVHNQEGEGKISPLAGLSNVILTPHIGAMTVDSQREIGHRIDEIVSSYASECIKVLI